MIPSLPTVNDVASLWGDAMLRACWQGSVAIVIIWLVVRLVPSLTPGVQCWLWRLALVKLLVALVWVGPVELPLLPARDSAAVPSGQGPASHDGTGTHSADAAVGSDLTATAVGPFQETANSLKLSTWLFLAWLVVAGWFAGLTLYRWLRTCRLVHGSESLIDPALEACYRELAERLSLRRLPRLLKSDGVPVPLIARALWPVIVLPAELLNRCTREEIRLMLAHELAHLKRDDLAWNGLDALVRTLFFFHPLVWLAHRETQAAQEMACDALALEATGAAPREYGGVLLKAVAHARQRPAVQLSGIPFGKFHRRLSRRIVAMKSVQQVSRGRRAFAAVALSAIAVVGLVPWRVVAQSPASVPLAPAIAPSVLSNVVSNNWMVFPVTTELQRMYFFGRDYPDAKAWVLLDGNSLLAENGRILWENLNEQALRKALEPFADREKGVVLMSVYYGIPTSEGEVRPENVLNYALRGFGEHAGFQTARVSNNYNNAGDFDWNQWIAEVNEAVAGQPDGDESPVGDDLVRLYPVRTILSRYLFSKVDCVVEVAPPVEGAPVIRPDVLDAIRRHLPLLQLRHTERITLRVRSKGTQGREAVQEWVNSQGPMRIGELLGFKHCLINEHPYR